MNKQNQINDRLTYIKSIQQFVLNSKNQLDNILCELDWTEEATFSKEGSKKLCCCPQNEEHRVGPNNLQKHLVKCSWHLSGYKDDSLALPEAGKKFPTTVVIDKNLQADIILNAVTQNPALKIGANVREREVPQTSDRLFSDFTTDERRVLYDYVVSRTSAAVPRLNEFSLPTMEETKREPLTKEQILAAERDAKRRRVRYRAAKVHTKSKNYSEVMREVINNQMLAYEDWLREQGDVIGPANPNLPEPQKTEELVQNKQEMIWLDWDYRSNPHVRWKYLLEQEKRRSRKKEADSREEQSRNQDHRRKHTEASTSRSTSQSEESKKYSEHHRRNRYGNELAEKCRTSRADDSEKDHHRDDYRRRERKEESSGKSRRDHKYDRHYKDVYKEDKIKKERDSYYHNKGYSEYQSKGEYYKKYNHRDLDSPSYDKCKKEKDFKVDVKKESDFSYESNQKVKPVDKHKSYNNDLSNSDSNVLTDQSSSSASTKKRTKRKKKKKKHKSKHKSKRSRREHSSESSE